MANYVGVLRKEINLKLNIIKDDYFSGKDKEAFRPSGTQMYIGRQGSGKTISAVNHADKLKKRYPKAILVTNLVLTGYTPVTFKTLGFLQRVLKSPDFDPSFHYIQFSDFLDLSVALVAVNNGKYGVIYIIDEIHTYVNALDSKNIPMFIFTEISQQRKQRKVIIGTSQLFDRVALPVREQCDNFIVCRTYFGLLTTQTAYDADDMEKDFNGKYIGTVRKRGFFFHTRYLRSLYDTYQKVISGRDQFDMETTTNVMLNGGKNNKAMKRMMK